MLSEKQKKYYLERLFELLRIPSISTLPKHRKDIHNAAAWLVTYLKDIGFSDVQELYAKTATKDTHHPVIYACRIDNPDNPTLLIYGHYDVQPVDPIDLWDTPPFEPTIRDEKIYARGSAES